MSQNIRKPMEFSNYRPYVSAETMMGPNSIRILGELLEKHPPRLAPDDLVLDLGCGKGLTSLVLAKETSARIYAADLWVRAEENEQRFIGWGVDRQIVAIGADANHLPFEEKQFAAMVSVDAYHYFGGRKSPKLWKELIGHSDRIKSVETWEMDCFDQAWSDWLAVDNPYAADDRRYFDTIIKPYTCFVGIQIKLKSQQ